MDILVKVVQFLLSLTILVLVHEMGHFLLARLFKIRVEKFRIFFDPKFTLWKKKIGETDFGIGWVPLGGYVKIAGMIDESMDTEQMKKPAQPWEFRSKPAWQRLCVMVAGVVFNLLFAWGIYAVSLNAWGDQYLPNENAIHGVVCSDIAQEIGFENGDKIVSIYGDKVEGYSEMNGKIIMDYPGEVEVIRNGQKKSIYVRADEIAKVIASGVIFTSPRIPFIIAKVVDGSSAANAGLMPNDKLIGLNNESLLYYDQYASQLANHASQTVTLQIIREGETMDKQVQLDSLGKIGVYATSPYSLLEIEERTYSFMEAIPQGLVKAKQNTINYVKQIQLMFSPEVKASESLGGFMTIGSIFPSFWNWRSFWELTALLSIMLGVMNILPIPALDGGHVVILLFEIITRRKPNQRFLEIVQMIGIFLLLGLMLFANINDVIRFFFN